MYKFKTTLLLLILCSTWLIGQTTINGQKTRLGKTDLFLTLPKTFKLIKRQGMDYQAFELISKDSNISGTIYIGNFPRDIVTAANCETEYITSMILNQKTNWLIDKCSFEYMGQVRINLEDIEKIQFTVTAKSKKDLDLFVAIIESLRKK